MSIGLPQPPAQGCSVEIPTALTGQASSSPMSLFPSIPSDHVMQRGWLYVAGSPAGGAASAQTIVVSWQTAVGQHSWRKLPAHAVTQTPPGSPGGGAAGTGRHLLTSGMDPSSRSAASPCRGSTNGCEPGRHVTLWRIISYQACVYGSIHVNASHPLQVRFEKCWLTCIGMLH